MKPNISINYIGVMYFAFVQTSCGGLVVKASASQLGSRRFESHRVRTDIAGWLATSYLNNSTDCLPAGHLALGNGIWGNDLCKLRCLISRILAGPFNRGWHYNKPNFTFRATYGFLNIWIYCITDIQNNPVLLWGQYDQMIRIWDTFG